MANVGVYSISMRHYQQACQESSELSSKDRRFQERIRGMVHNFHSPGGGEGSSNTCTHLSFDIIKEAMICILENNTQAAYEILAYKQGMGGNAQILDMVKNYFNLCKTTQDSLSKLQVSVGDCINKLTAVLQRDGPPEEVKEAVGSAEGVVDNFFLTLPHLIGKHVAMLTALQQARDKDMAMRGWRPENSTAREVTTIIVVTVFATAVICSILASAFHLNPVLAALPPAVISIVSWGPFIQWMDSFWVEDEEALTRRAAERVSVWKKTNIVIQELEEFKLFTYNTVSLPRLNTTLTDDGKRAVLNALLKNMVELGEQMENCRSDMCMARRKFLEKITEPNRRTDRVRVSLSRKAARIGDKIKRPLENMSEKFDYFAGKRKF